MNDERDLERDFAPMGCLERICWIAFALVVILSAVFFLSSLCSCTRTTYVPVETVRTEYRDRDVEKLVTDTVHDTRFVWVKGDTVVDIRDRWHKQLEYVHDTCYVERRDSIRVPYPVERKLTAWQKVKMDMGGVAMGGLFIALCVAVVWLVKKFRR